MVEEKYTLSAKSVRKDLKLGMSNKELMQKYKLSPLGLRSLLVKMGKAGLLSQDELDWRLAVPLEKTRLRKKRPHEIPDQEESSKPSEPVMSEIPNPKQPVISEIPEPSEPVISRAPEPIEPVMSEISEPVEPRMSEIPESAEPRISDIPEPKQPVIPEKPERAEPVTSEIPRPEESLISESPEPTKPVISERPKPVEPVISATPKPAKPVTPEVPKPKVAFIEQDPVDIPERPLSTEFDIKAVSGAKGDWHVLINPKFIRIHAPDGSKTFEIMKSQADEKLELRTPMLVSPILIVTSPKRIAFQLDRNKAEILKNWLGPMNAKRLAGSLKRRFAFCIAVGLFMVVMSMPMGGDASTGAKDLPADYLGMGLGLSLIVLGLLSKFWPRPILFLLDSLWFLALGAKIGYGVLQGESGVYWLIFTAIMILVAIQSLVEFLRYRKIPTAPEPTESDTTAV